METGERDAPRQQAAVTRRLFVAVLPGTDAQEELVRTQGLLLPHLSRAGATGRENLHLTLAFLGELDSRDEARVMAAMAEAAHAFHGAGGRPFALELGRVGRFGRRRHGGDVLWRGAVAPPGETTSSDALVLLQGLLARALRDRGLAVDGRPYAPHITLARGCRVATGGDMEDVLVRVNDELAPRARAGAHEERARPATMGVTAMSLMWSHHPQGGPLTYTEVARQQLAEGE